MFTFFQKEAGSLKKKNSKTKTDRRYKLVEPDKV